ncbi:MAG: hemolysin family protein [Synergistaceae bacterium]|jgi:CBS domain containing-hemolysin-like protein|nr:hemolysin family protein [Synergistaceae bacterium]
MEAFADIVVPLLEGLFWLAVLLFLSAFCSASETAITSVGRGKLLALQETRPFYRSLFQWLIDDIQRVLTLCLIANNVVNIGASTLATAIALRIFGVGGLVYVVPFMTVMVVIFGEILPKSVAIIYTERILLFCTPILRVFDFLIYPFTRLMQTAVYAIGWFLHIDLKRQSPFVTREEIEQVVNIGEQSGALEAVERRMIHGVIDFEETRVYEIMVPRVDIVELEATDTIGAAMEVFIEHGHSRLPVYDDSPDNIVGILYVKDTLKHLIAGDLKQPVGSLLREPMFVPESIRTVELLEAMRRDHVHIAVVVDEYGGIAGIVTMEDLLEEIVGEIQDEYDQEVPDIIEEEDGTYLVQGNMSLEDLSEALKCPFESEDAESIAGLVLSLAGNFPEDDDEFEYENWIIKVVALEDHRIKLLRLARKDRDPKNTENGLKIQRAV